MLSGNSNPTPNPNPNPNSNPNPNPKQNVLSGGQTDEQAIADLMDSELDTQESKALDQMDHASKALERIPRLVERLRIAQDVLSGSETKPARE